MILDTVIPYPIERKRKPVKEPTGSVQRAMTRSMVRGRPGALCRNICDPLADALLRGDIRDGASVIVSAGDEGLVFGWTWKLSARKRAESEDPAQFF